ncbi:unnamed protein product [Ostreobium quekettii]|uniref:Uncharacterized protein n=1 Tax=Ostreobium quekettii TaxID=121088 RepID=A0A8S1IY01_9CHLO|nr:unnamed protein product [Ostreobium quekettii]
MAVTGGSDSGTSAALLHQTCFLGAWSSVSAPVASGQPSWILICTNMPAFMQSLAKLDCNQLRGMCEAAPEKCFSCERDLQNWGGSRGRTSCLAPHHELYWHRLPTSAGLGSQPRVSSLPSTKQGA